MMQQLKDFIKVVLTPFLGPRSLLWLCQHFAKRDSLNYPSVNKALWFNLLAEAGKSISFIHIGAHDGIKNDPIYAFVKPKKWTGTFVEPIPQFFAQLKENYQGVPNLRFENVGIAETEGVLDFYHLPPEYTEPNWLQQVGSFDRRAIEFNLKVLPEYIPAITQTKIPTISLKTLFQRSGLERIDLLLLDVEGLEWEILKQLKHIDLFPTYIFFEWGCLGKSELDALIHFLSVELKYKLYSFGADLLAVKQ